MRVEPQLANRTIVESEFRALQAMCQDSGMVTLRERALALLSGYRFRSPLHQLVFDALRSLPSAEPKVVRASLIRRLTTLGFPDVDIEPFFQRHAMSAEAALSIMDRLALAPHGDLPPRAGPL